MSDPQPPFQANPGQFQPPQPERRIPTWAIVLIAVFGGTAILCVAISVAAVVGLNMMSSRVSTVFNRINSELETSATDTANQPVVFSTTAPVSTSGAHALGQPIPMGDLEVTVQSAGPVASGQNDLPPGKGKSYLAIKIEARNTGASEAYLAAFDTRVQDGAGAVSELSLFGQSAEQQTLFQTIAPGKTLTTTFVYEVADSATELFWIYSNANESRTVVKVK